MSDTQCCSVCGEVWYESQMRSEPNPDRTDQFSHHYRKVRLYICPNCDCDKEEEEEED